MAKRLCTQGRYRNVVFSFYKALNTAHFWPL